VPNVNKGEVIFAFLAKIEGCAFSFRNFTGIFANF
jgi:hypothetical protein